jgi:5-methylcytosine-specific restriction endonuclease McrA
MKFELKNFNRNISEEDLINDLNSVNSKLDKSTEILTSRSYDEYGKYSSQTISKRFNGWNNALIKARIRVAEQKNISNKDLFANLEKVWVELGRQPTVREMVKPLSCYSYQTYKVRFNGWNNATALFIYYMKEEKEEEMTGSLDTGTDAIKTKKRTTRNISDRKRFYILMRDGFTCKSCGASPIKDMGVSLHVDHIIPWSKGGETEDNNLQTKCKTCNLGKGNAFNV